MNTSDDQPGIKVLVIDDEAPCRDMITTILQMDGLDAVSTPDAESAVSLLNDNVYDAVVSDIMLPGMSGIGLLKHIRINQGDMPVIMITGFSSIDTAVNALQLGAQDYIVKPLGDCRTLISAIRNSVGQHRLAAEKQAMERKLTEAVENERQRLGRELHDLLCQDLASIAMLSSVLGDDIPDAKLINELAKKSVSFVKGLCSGLFPVELEEAGFVAAVSQLAQNQEAITNTSCTVDSEDGFTIDDKATALQAYRIIQESINNALKHSSATEISVALVGNNGHRTITVEDNGKGIQNLTESSGMGIPIMKYRANMIGANLQIARGETIGTKVECSW